MLLIGQICDSSLCTKLLPKNSQRKCLDGVYYKATRALVRLSWQNKICTGWFVGSEGHVLTAYHCISQVKLNEIVVKNTCHKQACFTHDDSCREIVNIGVRVVAS
ncbi:hypothetical protein THRCLA_20128 [Thraustotheca clavata]|uniref:Peptidase S1 domain-containing protein n=1 Tax=Thraustotheca clavata TaxID=74557 RepID=A0A1W0AB50_9STRA|nr:hypothetical protein THRCLA_20128 [Thraustotheca clavata]